MMLTCYACGNPVTRDDQYKPFGLCSDCLDEDEFLEEQNRQDRQEFARRHLPTYWSEVPNWQAYVRRRLAVEVAS